MRIITKKLRVQCEIQEKDRSVFPIFSVKDNVQKIVRHCPESPFPLNIFCSPETNYFIKMYSILAYEDGLLTYDPLYIMAIYIIEKC